jgi:hypothetical protein
LTVGDGNEKIVSRGDSRILRRGWFFSRGGGISLRFGGLAGASGGSFLAVDIFDFDFVFFFDFGFGGGDLGFGFRFGRGWGADLLTFLTRDTIFAGFGIVIASGLLDLTGRHVVD